MKIIERLKQFKATTLLTVVLFVCGIFRDNFVIPLLGAIWPDAGGWVNMHPIWAGIGAGAAILMLGLFERNRELRRERDANQDRLEELVHGDIPDITLLRAATLIQSTYKLWHDTGRQKIVEAIITLAFYKKVVVWGSESLLMTTAVAMECLPDIIPSGFFQSCTATPARDDDYLLITYDGVY